MKRLALLFTAGAMALAAGFMAAPSQAADKEITVVTWNIPYYTDGFQKWVDAFKKIHPDYDVKRIDMKGTELPAWYQTQVVAARRRISSICKAASGFNMLPRAACST